MTSRDGVVTEVEHRVEALGFELVALDWAGSSRRPILRLRVDRPDSVRGEGITVGECARVSRALEAWLDEAMPERYVLEVSSPGIERPLTRPRDWVRFAGQRVALRTRRPVDGDKRRFEGELMDAGSEDQREALMRGEGTVRLRLDGGDELCLELEDIERAHLVYDWKS
jgi:ribosome maturation factor RimP